MNNWLMIFLAILVVASIGGLLFFILKPSEKDSSVLTATSKVDCNKYPDAPDCQTVPDVGPTLTELDTCMPSDGRWSIAGVGVGGRSSLNSPCCQPPDFKLAKGYKTCDSALSSDDPNDRCIMDCCAFAKQEATKYDPALKAVEKLSSNISFLEKLLNERKGLDDII